MQALVVACFLSSEALKLALDYWTADWTAGKHSSAEGVTGYAIICAVALVVVTVAALLLVRASISASRGLHDRMLTRLIHAPVSFFDVTPTGAILNRCSRDVMARSRAADRSKRVNDCTQTKVDRKEGAAFLVCVSPHPIS